MRVLSRLIATAAAAACLGFTAASAATVSLSGITASWINLEPSAAGIAASGNGTATPSVRWGIPATYHGKSGYDFAAAGDINTAVPPGGEFALGVFTHRNFPVYEPVLTSATLQVAVNVAVNGGAAQLLDFFFDFTHFETPNDAKVCANGGANNKGVNTNGCADLVTFSNNSLSQSFLVDGMLYTIAITGFKVGDAIIGQFWTKEKYKNSAILMASITAQPSEVPLPAALPLFLAGVAGMSLASRRRRQAA